jgi:Spy/CpxP family protein refolding chaperone
MNSFILKTTKDEKNRRFDMKRSTILVIFVTLLAAIPLAIQSAAPIRGFAGRPGMGPGMHQMHNPLTGLLAMFRVADELELTGPQLLQLRLVWQKAAADFARPDMKAFSGLAGSSMNEEEVKKAAAAMAKSVEQGIIAHYNLIQEVKKILTPEQIKKLEERKNFRGRPGRRHQPGDHDLRECPPCGEGPMDEPVPLPVEED